jgi:hypothetical protein
MALDSSCPSSRVSGQSYFTNEIYRAHRQSQEQSSGIVTLDEDDPVSIDELLKYLYTLSDHFNVSVIKPHDGTHWNGEVKDIESLPGEIKHRADVLAVADRFCVSDLDGLASEKMQHRLPAFKNRLAMMAHQNPADTLRFVSALSDTLYSGDKIPALQYYQSFFAQIFTSKFHIATDVLDIKGLIQSHPKLGCDLLQERDKTIESQQQTIKSIYAEMPKSQRKLFD